MYNPSELSVTFNPSGRWLKLGLFIVIAVIGGARLYEGLEIGKTPYILMGGAIIVLAIFGSLQIIRYRVLLTEGYIEQQSVFGQSRLMYTEILQAKERKRTLYLHGPTQTIRIRHDTDRRDEVIAKLAPKLNALPVLIVHGDLLNWGIKDRDDEGRLIRR